MFQSCLTKHLLKADILFRGEFEIIPVDSGICRCRASDPLFRGCHQSGSLSGVTRERHPASQSEHLSYAEKIFGIQRYSSLASSEAKNPRRKNFRKIYAKPPSAILQPCGRQNKPSVRTGAVWSGHRNRGISPSCILQHERSIFLLRSLSRYKLHEIENGILNGLTQ